MLIILKEIRTTLPQINNLRHLKARQFNLPLYHLITLRDVNIPRNKLTPHLIGHRLNIFVLLVLWWLWADGGDVPVLHFCVEGTAVGELALVGFKQGVGDHTAEGDALFVVDYEDATEEVLELGGAVF
jgi:hypothetical protein